MKLTAYQKILKLGKEKIEEVLSTPRAEEMRSKAKCEIASLDVRIAEKENKIADLASKYPIDFNAVIAAQDDLALTQRRKTQLEKIVTELFPG